MSLADNITKAFEIVDKTYENVEKLIKYCDAVAEDNNYISMHDRFLRYKSDKDYEGWMTRVFVKLYQQKEDNELESEWRNGPVYVMEINFYEEPTIYISKFEYENMTEWSKGVSPSSFWVFSWPTVDGEEDFKVCELEGKTDYSESVPVSDSIKKKYWGLKRAVFTERDLTGIDKENVVDKVFKQFDNLREL